MADGTEVVDAAADAVVLRLRVYLSNPAWLVPALV